MKRRKKQNKPILIKIFVIFFYLSTYLTKILAKTVYRLASAFKPMIGCAAKFYLYIIALSFIASIIVMLIYLLYQLVIVIPFIAGIALWILMTIFYRRTIKQSELNLQTVNNSQAVVMEQMPRRKLPAGYVYLLKDVEITGRYKIGRTNYPKSRMKLFAVKLPFDTELIHIFETSNCIDDEKNLHEKFSEKRRQGEWFELNQGDVDYIKAIGVVESSNLDDKIPLQKNVIIDIVVFLVTSFAAVYGARWFFLRFIS